MVLLLCIDRYLRMGKGREPDRETATTHDICKNLTFRLSASQRNELQDHETLKMLASRSPGQKGEGILRGLG